MRHRQITTIANKYGTPLYLLDMERFRNNYKELDAAFRNVYEEFRIAYSFKTNYTPVICKKVMELGGYAEVVSTMEYNMAKRFGFKPKDIIVNGPGKIAGLTEMIVDGALVMLDNSEEMKSVLDITKEKETKANIGFRLNFEIGSGKDSRFGFDANKEEIRIQIEKARKSGRIQIRGLHFHLSGARSLEAWKNRAKKMIAFADDLLLAEERCILDLGSGMFGHMDESLANQFPMSIPSFSDYAREVAGCFYERFGKERIKTQLIVEPGTTIVANTMDYVTTVVATKTIRDRSIAIVDGSVQQLGEIGKKKRLPIEVIHNEKSTKSLDHAEITGYTCLEDDILHPYCEETIGIGDMVVFHNAGAYSNVLKPPFIQPGCKIVMTGMDGEIVVCKREETLEDILASYLE